MRRLKKIDPDAVTAKTLELSKDLIEGNWKTIIQGMKESGGEGKFTLNAVIKPSDIGHELTVKFKMGIQYGDEESCELTDPDQEEMKFDDN